MSSRPKRTPRLRTLARQERVVSEKLARARNKLIDVLPGGTAEHPLEVSTAAVIEAKAESVHCPRCDLPFSVESHEARADAHGRLREVRVKCAFCGEARALWFRISAPS